MPNERNVPDLSKVANAMMDNAVKTIIKDRVEDTRTPNQKRLDELIELNDDILEEMKTMNKNLAIVGAALLKMVESKSQKAKKPIDNG